MNVLLIDDGLNESQPAGSVPDFEPDLLTVDHFRLDNRAEPAENAEELL